MTTTTTPNMPVLSDVALVHELALNPDAFNGGGEVGLALPGSYTAASNSPRQVQVNTNDTSAIEKLFKDQMYRAFFDQINEQRERNKDEWARTMTNMLVEMRDSLLSAIPPRFTDQKRRLSDLIDDDFVFQMLTTDNFHANSVLSLFQSVHEVILAVELPMRNNESRDWWRSITAKVETDPDGVPALIPDMFRFVNDKVEQLNRDILTAQLELLKPIAETRGAEYERQHYTNTATTKTRQWLKHALTTEADTTKALVVSPPSSDLNAILEGVSGGVSGGIVTETGLKDVVRLGGLYLVARSSPWGEDMGETLELDARRVHAMQNTLQLNILLGVAVSLAHQFDHGIGGGAATPTTTEWLTSLTHPVIALLQSPNVRLPQIKQFLEKVLLARAQSRGSQASQNAAAIVGVFDSACSPDHVLYKTVQKRVLAFVWAILQNNKDAMDEIENGDKVPMSFVAEFVSPWASQLDRMCSHNFKVFSDVYRKIVEELVIEQ